jgi:hypothetical protein
MNLSNTALVAGNANGTYIGANPAANLADFMNYQVAGVSKFKADVNGSLICAGSVSCYRAQITAPGGGSAALGIHNRVGHDGPLFTCFDTGGGALVSVSIAGVFTLGATPPASTSGALFNLTGTAISGGNANGTYIAANPASTSADFVNLQVGSATKLRVDSSGNSPLMPSCISVTPQLMVLGVMVYLVTILYISAEKLVYGSQKQLYWLKR